MVVVVVVARDGVRSVEEKRSLKGVRGKERKQVRGEEGES